MPTWLDRENGEGRETGGVEGENDTNAFGSGSSRSNQFVEE